MPVLIVSKGCDMDPVLIGLRSQDYHESLRTVGTFMPKDVHFKKTLLIGKAASLAMHLRGLLYIDNYQHLEIAAVSLGIGSLELDLVLKQLEAVDFISVVRDSSDRIKRVDIRVPEFRSGYKDLGSRWTDLSPSEIEQAGVSALDTLYGGPRPSKMIKGMLGLGDSEYSMMSEVMEAGNLLVTQTVDGVPMSYTPLAIDGNHSAYLQWAKKFPKEVNTVVNALRTSQGTPLTNSLVQSNPALADAVHTGVLMPVQVSGSTGVQHFLFAPHGGLDKSERAVLDKARAIVSCVRYGQSFAAGRPIRNPQLIISTLRDKKKFSRGHPDLFAQYGLLVEKMIGTPVDEGGGRWNFQIHETPENMKALQVASEMIEHGDAPSTGLDLEAQKALLGPSNYFSPPSARPILAKQIAPSRESSAVMIREMAKMIRGSAI